MTYLTGMLAFGIPCDYDTPGKWNLGRSDYLDKEQFITLSTEDSPIGDWGVVPNCLVPGYEYMLMNVANHVRAYVDLLVLERFDLLKDAFFEYINNAKARKDIFMIVYGKLRHTANFPEINDFMEKEFGNAWYSYVDAAEKSAAKLAENEDALKVLTEYTIPKSVPVGKDLEAPYVKLDKDTDVPEESGTIINEED